MSNISMPDYDSELLETEQESQTAQINSRQQEMIAVDPQSQHLMDVAARVAATNATVMIFGESGVGKEIVARFIHRQSNRSKAPFIAINCAAIPENMLESVLFGYEKGAFTGAYQGYAGKFEQAQGGTLLLDEITEMDLSLQAKLLRVLQEREVERLGGKQVIALDVRVLATSNRDVRQSVVDGFFREDLYYRLNVFPINILPLRKRTKDVMPLALSLMQQYAGTDDVSTFSRQAMDKLLAHSWPGNVRELDNVVQRAVILKHGNIISADDICLDYVIGRMNDPFSDKDFNATLGANLKTKEKDLILNALKEERNKKDAAAKLGISPRTLRYKLARLRAEGCSIPA